jgi:phosphatidylglycerophosphatase C
VSRPVVAAFDFDGTLTRGGSVWPYLSAMVGPGKVLFAGLVLAPKLVWAALVGGSAADRTKEALFTRTLAGLDAAELEERSAAFGEAHYRRHGRADVRARFEWHRSRGHRVVIVSASPVIYVGAVAAALGADGVLATRLESDGEGRMTGRYDGGNCRGEEKVARLRAWIDAHVRPEADGEPYVWAYGNSRGDLWLLDAADIGVDVGRLGYVGKLRRFPRLSDLTGANGSTGSDSATR